MSVRARGSVVAVSLLVSLATVTSACAVSTAPAPDERTASATAPVIKGSASDASQDAVVKLEIRVGNGGGLCTGTLIAPNLVLTARHCVAETSENIYCKPDGTPGSANAARVKKDYPADDITVFTGPADLGYGASPDGVGAKVITNGATSLCNNDIALLLLAEPITNAPIAQLRLDASPTKGERVTVVGWGVTEKPTETPYGTIWTPSVRQQRKGVPILAVSSGGVGPNEFLVGESICQGDSGGPALVEPSGAVVGVVSRGGNGQHDEEQPALGCLRAQNLYTQVAPFKEYILAAFEEAGYEPWIEGQPDPRLAPFDGKCTKDAQCRSNICVVADGKGVCSQSCDETECPDGFECTSPSGAAVCTAKKPPAPPPGATSSSQEVSAGCSASPGTANGPLVMGLFFATFALGGILRRVRRRAR